MQYMSETLRWLTSHKLLNDWCMQTSPVAACSKQQQQQQQHHTGSERGRHDLPLYIRRDIHTRTTPVVSGQSLTRGQVAVRRSVTTMGRWLTVKTKLPPSPQATASHHPLWCHQLLLLHAGACFHSPLPLDSCCCWWWCGSNTEFTHLSVTALSSAHTHTGTVTDHSAGARVHFTTTTLHHVVHGCVQSVPATVNTWDVHTRMPAT